MCLGTSTLQDFIMGEMQWIILLNYDIRLELRPPALVKTEPPILPELSASPGNIIAYDNTRGHIALRAFVLLVRLK